MMSNGSNTNEYLTLGESGYLLRVGERTVRRYIARGRLVAVRVGKRILIPADSVRALLEMADPA